jgi:16S rRNA (guanine527-N7)-methyltransferase
VSRAEVERALGPLVEREGGAPSGWVDGVAEYLALLQAANQRINLISRKTAPEALDRHLVPSLAALRLVPAAADLRVLDVGTGGGLPGLLLALLRPRSRFDLVDATRKKCEFVAETARTLGLKNVQVHWCRVEEPTEELSSRAPFDRVIARAVGVPDLLAGTLGAWIAPGGGMWVFSRPEEGGEAWSDGDGRPVTALTRLI